MTPEEIALIRDCFAKVVPIKETAAEIFYNRLFETAPEVKSLFTGDMKKQGEMLMSALAGVVDNLDNLDAIVPDVQGLARRHVRYGVEADHYQPVGAALLWTLEQGLGDDFTAETGAAWAKAYGTLSGVMIEEAYTA